MKAVIFGADKLGIAFYFKIRATEEVVAFVDNDVAKQGQEVLGVKILSAEELLTLEIDKVYIASALHFKAIGQQMEKLGIPRSIISLLPVQLDKQKVILDELYPFQEIYWKDEFDGVWMQLKEQYACIKAYELRVEAIGELIPRFFMIQNNRAGSNVLSVFIPKISDKRICNKYLLELLGRKIYIVQESNVAFWTYILKEYIEDVDISEYNKYSSRNNYPTYKVNHGNSEPWFTDEEMERGKATLEKMGLTKPYVCLAARTASYNQRTIGHDFCYSYRNTMFHTYGAAINYLQQQNIATIKMGRMEDSMTGVEGCIDYAGLYANDFMDLYLASECEFMVANMSGIFCMASLFCKPVLIVNAVPVSLGCGGMQFTDKDLYIPKKYYDENRGRYLSLREMMELEASCLIYGDRYERAGIKFIDNTAEEIASAVQEFLERLRGNWQDTIEDQKNHGEYLRIYHEMKVKTAKNAAVWIGGPLPFRIAASYLRDNSYLLV